MFAALLPHAQAALDPASDGMAQIARYLGASGSYAAARDLQRQVLQAREEILGAEHPDTLDRPRRPRLLDRGGGGCGRGPGPVRRAAAGPRAGLGRRAPRHPDRPRQPGPLDRGGGGCGRGPGPVRRAAAGPRAGPGRRAPRHADRPRQPGPLDRGGGGSRPGPGTSSPRCCRCASGSWAPSTPTPSTARGNLARWTGEAGDAAGARDQYAALLPVRERVLGAEHPDTLAARANLAYWTGRAGDAAAARDQFAALLPVRERVLGAEHPDTLTARANLAHWAALSG